MIDENKRKLQERMAELHEKYCNQLPGKYHEIQDDWNEYKTDFSNPKFIEKFYRLIHTLKGTAATFGFVTQADICFDIQKVLLKAQENNALLNESSAVQIEKHLAELKANINSPAKNFPN